MNLHYFITFSSRGSGVYRSLFLRTFMVMMFFITGSNGLYAGEDLKATIGTPPSEGKWDGSTGTYSWTKAWNNLMPIFTITKGTLNTDYVALKFTTSKYTDKYRVCFMNGGDVVATFTLESAGAKTIKISELKVNEGKDLSQVDNIKFGGLSTSGSITLDPNSIVLIGQSQVKVSQPEANKGTVYFTVGNDDATQHTSATVPNHTKVKFYAKPNTENVVFTGWEVADKVIYDNPAEVEVTGDLNFKARFPDGIHISCTVEPNGAAEPNVYQTGHPEWPLPVDGYVGPGQATTFAFKNDQKKYKFLGWYDAKNNNLLSRETSYTVNNINAETKVIAKFSTSEINEECEITVDGKTRKYWLYVPASLEGKKDVPVVFSLHGRYNNDNPNEGGKPVFTSLAKEKGFIVVYPQGRDAKSDQDKADYPGDWYNAFGNGTGWEATGKENADTKFIKAIVDEIKKIYNSNSNISVDPKKFYLCGFSMGGMMTYACAKVLNGTFAAYGSCGGFPLNEFHLNLATKQPIPFIHMHGSSDNMLGIKHLHTIIENLLFRNGCSLKDKNTTTQWTTTNVNGETHDFKRYDFTGVNGVPVTTVTFKDLWHSVEESAPKYLWDFFSKTSDTYKPTTTTMKWQWDMTTINEKLKNNSNKELKEIHGWKRVAISGNDHGTLTYGDNRKTDCTGSTTNNGTTTPCGSAASNCNGNHNVYNSIQLEKGTYKLHAQATVVKSDNTGIIVGIYKVGATDDKGTCIVRRQVKNNSGDASADLSILYPFTVTEDGEYYVKIERGNAESSCTALAIHTSDYNPDDVDDSENAMTLTEGWKNTGLIVKIDFESENVGANCENIDDETKYIKEGKDQNKNDYIHFTGTVPTEGYKLYNCHKGDNKQKWAIKDVILHDEVFGNYFQNIPKAQFYDRSAGQNYMRAVLKDKALSPIRTSGEATIGFWVNGRVAVDAGLSYNDASMLYLTGPWHSSADVDGENNRREYQSMFNIRCNGNTNGFLNSKTGKQIRYYANDMFGDLCDNETTEKYYKKNLYLDRNWHYVTMVMYNGLRNVDMYVDGELTNSRKNIVGGDQDLTAGLDSINHIIIGGLNATYTTFGYDPAFAFDDIVIYSRALSSQEINQIISDKKYSPNSWDFEKDIANPALLNVNKLEAGGLWTSNESKTVYTLNRQLSTEAELTYDGIRVIPAFRGLKFVTGTTGKIQIDMANHRLVVTGITNAGDNATKMTISNAPAGQYLRYEYDEPDNDWLDGWNNQLFQGDFSISNSKTVITKVSGSGRQTCTCNVNGTISFKSIGSTDKVYADLYFGTYTDDKTINRVSKVDFNDLDVDVTGYNNYPKLLLIENGTGFGGKINFKKLTDDKYSGKIKFWSSAPHVAYIEKVENNQPTVKATGIPGSAYIYAELENNNEYDCNNENAGLYESSSRIIARYEIHVPNKETGYSVKISADETHNDNDHKFPVGYVLETTDQNKAVTLTLGGWKYNSGEYFKKTDGYTKKEQWNGMPLKKTKNDTNGYSSEYDTSSGAATTDGDTYSALSSYTGGTHAASSEQMDGNPNTGLFSTTVINNSTAWTLPCRGSYAKVEPTEAGIISVYVLQEGCMERNMTGTEQTYFDSYKVAANEPYDINIKKVYVADEAGKIIDDVITDTKSKIVSQVWKDDGRARAEYSYYVANTAYSELLHQRFMENIVKAEENPVALLDKWNSPGMTQNIIPYRKGYAVIDKGIVRYTFNVLPGKTYYIFSNDAKMGIAGFNFTKNKQLNFNSEHEIIAYNPLAGDLTPTESVTLNDGENYPTHTEKNANVTLNRTFYKNRWNAICLPYSINRRQIEDQFGDGTMVVLMKNIETSTKKVMFIEHANQDIIAGYPYLIFPTDKADNDKTNHAPISGITTRATFGEANSPLFGVETDGTTYLTEPKQSDELVFKGTFKNAKLTEGSYVVTNNGVLSRIPKDGMNIKPYRSYIYFNRVNTGAKAISLQDMNVNGFENDEDHTTGIENLLFESGILTHSADVYSIDGQLVRSKALNFNGLPKGVYIVNGKKYVKK